MKIKICGLTRPEDITYANRLKPDYIGFVFALRRRLVTPDRAAELKKMLSPGIKAVGVFVDEEPDRIIALLRQGVIDIAQLHGNEEEETVRRIREETGAPVWKAIQMRSRESIGPWADSQADMLVLDNGKGTGSSFDWRFLSDIGRPFFLAGGICAENIRTAVRDVAPYGIDVSSGVETDGVKDYEKMRTVIRAVRESGG
ncbi:MAG: phosphoribosylanthranilate isomerase [Lachnospiraceae bacterium]|nr:phosphoribosylanthranilate isomerase [Lachnospiraceae bacterium]